MSLERLKLGIKSIWKTAQTWTQLRADMVANFSSDHELEAIREEFSMCRQKEGEPIQDYINLLQDLWTSCGYEPNDRGLALAMIKGLLPVLKGRVLYLRDSAKLMFAEAKHKILQAEDN